MDIRRGLIHSVLNPQRRELLWFSIGLGLIISVGLWFFSAIVYGQLVLLYGFFFAVGCASIVGLYLIDRILGFSTRYYAIRGVALFVILVVVELPVHAGLQALCDSAGDRVRLRVEDYYAKHGMYPAGLSDRELGDLPERTWLGSRFEYSRELDPFLLCYASIGGEERFYSHQYNCWSYPFDQ